MFLTPTPTRILRIVQETKNIKTFYLKNSEIAKRAKPGNFLLVWVPFPADNRIEGHLNLEPLDQIPMSISFADFKDEIVAITVKKVGSTTSELHKYVEGSFLGVIGPLGNSFSCNGDVCILVGGGTGVAPLYYLAVALAKKGKEVIGAFGFKTIDDVFFSQKMQEVCKKLIVTTEDQSYGEKGLITNLLPSIFKEQKGLRSKVHVYCCGPELMMKKVFVMSKSFNFSSEFSLERHIYCGFGLCGFCAFNGLRVCRDGPVFSGEQLEKIKDFGVSKRSASGREEKLVE